MKRKTNLFYLSGDESNFLTFSNYGESLTGNFLATNWKMFPSRFLCLYIKYLDVDDKSDFNKRKTQFIEYLTAHYENKMAFLRDYCLENNLSIESNLLPLNYLLESIFRIKFENNSFNINQQDLKTVVEENKDIVLSFVGNITEQDYNGTYTDIISLINSNDKPNAKIELSIKDQHNLVECNENNLHGWSTDEIELTPLFDLDNKYKMSSDIDKISITTSNENNNIKFNILIPLYDMVDISVHNDTTVLEENIGIKLNNTETYLMNLPLGIWISENTVELKRNKSTGFAPGWSLLLSSQFKPFPYSQKIPGEITQDSTKEAFATFAQVLIRQNDIMNKMEEMMNCFAYFTERIDGLENELKIVGTSYTSDVLNTRMIHFMHNQEEKLNAFKQEMYSYVLNTWKGYIG